MPIAWNDEQAAKVTSILHRYPPQSNQCELAAKAILPVARQVDASSHAMKIKPAGRALYLLPKISLHGEYWRHHVTTQASDHYIDSLTETPGTAIDEYFATHYQYDDAEAYVLMKIEL